MFVSPNKICRVVEALSTVNLDDVPGILIGKILHVPSSLYVSFAWYYFSSIVVWFRLSVHGNEWVGDKQDQLPLVAHPLLIALSDQEPGIG